MSEYLKLYQIYLDECPGWVTDNQNDLESEFEEYNNEFKDNKINISKAIRTIKNLESNESACFGHFRIECFENTKEWFDNLDEFKGW